MSCSTCVNQRKPNCDPDINEFGGCGNYKPDWTPPEDENYFYAGLFDDECGYETNDNENE